MNESYINSAQLKEALENNRFSKVIYASFDREKYLYTKEMKHHSIDAVLKASLCRPFIFQDSEKNECRAENYLTRFENAADENTLVVIDGFDVAAPSPYMRHLFTLPCTVLIITDKDMQNLPDGVLLVSKNSQDENEYSFEALNEKQKELLMTLCAFLEYLDDGIPIVSSSSGVFDKESVEFYLGELSHELENLEKYSLVTITDSGRICIDKDVRKQVFTKLCPDAENCKTFMAFVSKVCDYRPLQNVKDISAKLFAAEDDYNSFSSSLEFMSVYTHFSKSDKDRGTRIYNMLISHMLENLSMQKGALFTRHLLFKNAPYYISQLRECLLSQDVSEKIYDEELYMDEILPDIYTYRVKANLDIIRICLSFVRNMTPDMYNILESVFENLYLAMSEIFDYTENCGFDDEMKMALLDDCIRLCSESFDYSFSIDKDGVYYPFRDRLDERRIFYNCEKESDRLYADSIPLCLSALTVKLYSLYEKFLSLWLEMAEKTPINNYNTLLWQLHEEKVCDRTNTLEGIKAHLLRAYLGYENFTDIYSPEMSGKFANLINMEITEKRLMDNRRFLRRGFDGGTKKGADRYTDNIITTIKESKNPLRTVLTVLNPEYPMSDEALELLLKKDFVKHLCENKNMPNLSLQIVLETLVCDYPMCLDRKMQKSFYEELFFSVSENVNSTEAFLERMFRAVSSMYVKVKNKELAQKDKTSLDDFCDKLYEKYCNDKKFKYNYCDDYIAKAVFSKITGGRIDKDLIKQAVETHEKENNVADTEKLIEFLLK